MRILKALAGAVALAVMLFVLVFLVMALTMSAAGAQAPTTRVTPCSPTTPNNAVCLSWGAVTTRTDGLPTTFPVTYRVEQQISSGTWTVVNSAVIPTQLYVQNLAPGAYTFRVFAVENAVVSAASNQAGRTVVQTPPSTPVITIAVLISPDAPPNPIRITVNGAEVYAAALELEPDGR